MNGRAGGTGGTGPPGGRRDDVSVKIPRRSLALARALAGFEGKLISETVADAVDHWVGERLGRLGLTLIETAGGPRLTVGGRPVEPVVPVERVERTAEATRTAGVESPEIRGRRAEQATLVHGDPDPAFRGEAAPTALERPGDQTAGASRPVVSEAVPAPAAPGDEAAPHLVVGRVEPAAVLVEQAEPPVDRAQESFQGRVEVKAPPSTSLGDQSPERLEPQALAVVEQPRQVEPPAATTPGSPTLVQHEPAATAVPSANGSAKRGRQDRLTAAQRQVLDRAIKTAAQEQSGHPGVRRRLPAGFPSIAPSTVSSHAGLLGLSLKRESTKSEVK